MSDERLAVEVEDEGPRRLDRRDDLLGRRTSRARKLLVETWNEVKRGFEYQSERADIQEKCWDAYNAVLNAEQYFNGESQVYIPIIRDAVDAIATRDTNQLCPASGQFIEAISQDGQVNGPVVDLLHEYAQRARLKTEIVQAAIVMGMVEGQYNFYVDWGEIRRELVKREKRPMEVDGLPLGEDIEDVAIEDLTEGFPVVELLHDSDVLILPVASDSVEEALAAGGCVAIVRRWSKAKIKALAAAGIIRKDAAEELEDQMGGTAGRTGTPPDAEKMLAEIAGIRKKGTEATVWEIWRRLPLNERGSYDEDGVPRLCRMFFGPDQMLLGAVRNPNWNDRCPLVSRAVKKIPGVMKGRSPIEPVLSLQYEANDAANEAADNAHYSSQQVFLRDPAADNGPIVLNVGAIIDVPPNSFKAVEWPDLTPRAVARIQYCIAQIFQSLNVNPSMLPQQTSQSRRNQAQVAQEQAIDLLTTAIRVSVLEEVMTEVVGWWVDLDYQHRDRDLLVRTHGAMGVRTNMQDIPPLKTRDYYRFRWWGGDAARNAAQYQQQIAFLNVAMMMQPLLQAQGKSLDPVPAIEAAAGGIFGPRVSPLLIKDLRAQMSLDPELENELLANGDDVIVSPFDDDPKHLQSHMQAGFGDTLHVKRHQLQMQMKAQAAMMQQAQQMLAGPQGEAGGRASRAGQPRPGGQVQPMRPNRGPPGMIHPEALPRAGGIAMPRKY